MQKGDYLQAILRSPKTVFTLKDVALLWQEADTDAARVRLNYYIRKGDLYKLRRGLYAKSKTYEKIELATRIFTPSYVSFETVLTKEGLIFQYHTEITVASYLTRTLDIDGQLYSYKKMKDGILTNPTGVINENETSVATKERAFLDTLYINGDYHFDNTRSLDWDTVLSMTPMYDNKRMAKKVKQFYETRHINT
jgi:hypothetical protein